MKKIKFTLITISGLIFLASACRKDTLVKEEKKPESISYDVQSTASIPEETLEKDIFLSIMFGYGSKASSISLHAEQVQMIEGMNEEDLSELRYYLDKLYKEIRLNDYTFFQTFTQRILSHDHQEIRTAIEEATLKIYLHGESVFPGQTAMVEKIKEDIQNEVIITEGTVDYDKLRARMDYYKEQLNPSSEPSSEMLDQNFISSNEQTALVPCSWAVACVFYAALAVHNTIAVTVNIAFAAAVWRWIGLWQTVAGPKSSLAESDILKVEQMIDEIANFE